MEPSDIKIGDKFFMFDVNRRVYERDENGRATGGPIFRGHFYEVTIEGETTRSWITNYGRVKVPKSNPFPPLYTEDMIVEREFINDHKHRIADKVARIQGADTLRKIAAIIGYDT